jgi:hypothetical protein
MTMFDASEVLAGSKKPTTTPCVAAQTRHRSRRAEPFAVDRRTSASTEASGWCSRWERTRGSNASGSPTSDSDVSTTDRAESGGSIWSAGVGRASSCEALARDEPRSDADEGRQSVANAKRRKSERRGAVAPRRDRAMARAGVKGERCYSRATSQLTSAGARAPLPL